MPVRVVSEYAGAEVSWDGTTSTVYINSTDNVKYINWNDSYEYWGEIKTLLPQDMECSIIKPIIPLLKWVYMLIQR